MSGAILWTLMSDAFDPRSLIDSAEQAAANGDYATAERLLRQAAVLQEANVGPLHPDLAHTLNNLAVVCEIVDNPIDAEHYFRRACAIATAVLEPDHPFVATSRKNLEDFCAARGKAVKLPAAVSLVTDPRWTFPTPETGDSATDSGPGKEPRIAATRGLNRPLIGVALIACLLLTLGVAWWRVREPAGSPSRSAAASGTRPADSQAAPSRVAPAEIERPDSSAPAPEPPRKVASTAERRPTGEPSAPRSVSPRPAVVVAKLCRTLSTRSGEWRCVPPTDPLDAGPLVFYTRVKSASAVTVQHRWYRGTRLRRVVPLVIRANTSEGYRTFSRYTVSAEGSGEWKVELSTTDGAVLYEERFVVR